MRRTVNEARAPSPRLRMTVPSKTCVRSFSPSITFTYTRTWSPGSKPSRSEEHTSELQSRLHLVCRLLLEKKKFITHQPSPPWNRQYFPAPPPSPLPRLLCTVRIAVLLQPTVHTGHADGRCGVTWLAIARR